VHEGRPNVTVVALALYAFQVDDYQLIDMPLWGRADGFDVDAKAEGATAANSGSKWKNHAGHWKSSSSITLSALARANRWESRYAVGAADPRGRVRNH